MYDIFGPIRGILKVDSINIDNNIFKLHYKATVFTLLACSLLLTQKQYFGDPIDCLGGGSLGQEWVDTYCWIHSTYTLPAITNCPHPGVCGVYQPGREVELRKHTYYQWVTLIFYLQAIIFYLPHYIWKILEGGKLKMLVGDLCLPIMEEEDKENRIKMLVSYFWTNIDNHHFYAAKYFICELLNVVNVLGQIYFTDIFVGYEFAQYGSKVFSITGESFIRRGDPMELVFPKVTKCLIENVYGPSGTLETRAPLCVLPLNIFIEKIYIFLWFWYITLMVMSFLGMVYRLLTFHAPIRRVLLRSKARIAKQDEVDRISDKLGIGSWFFIYQIAKNIDPIIMRECITGIANEIP